MTTGKLTITTPTDRDIAMVREFDAPRSAVFDAWTKPEQLKKWMYGPEGHSLQTCEIDLRVGGKLRFVWLLPDGSTMGMSGEYREVVPPKRLVNTELFDEDWTGGETLVTSEFDERDGCTVFTLSIRYSSRKARDAALQSGMTEGMEMCHARLDTLLA